MTQDGAKPAKGRKLRVLLLEDRESDAELILHALRRSGFAPDWERVETESEFAARLDGSLDVILADYRLPKFDGLEALRRLQESKLDIPFIIVSGTLGDELAAQCIKSGVSDYLLKDRLDRLGLAVSNAIEEKRLRFERTLVEEQLRQVQKMDAVGQLAGGIAHDFNNLLTVINGHATILLERETFSPQTLNALRQIYMAGERAVNLTRQLLYFSRKRPIERVRANLNQIVEEVGGILSRLIGEHIKLVQELAHELPPIEADTGMIEQILINLAVNARDAMPRGGQVIISTRSIDLGADDLRGKPWSRPGKFVCLHVQDSGCGIAPELLPRIFEPFFTTKEVGKGTGLGLATAFGIVQQHQGWIEVTSEVGRGTTFKVFLPAANPDLNPVSGVAPVEGTIKGGAEMILVVEDETSVREFAVAVLQSHGYRVLQAHSGVDALAVWKRHSQRIDLLLTDMVMPDDMTGSELAARLLEEKPGLKVLFTSGYSTDMHGALFESVGKVRFIHKPYSPHALGTIVRKTLDNENSSTPPIPPTSTQSRPATPAATKLVRNSTTP